MYETCKTKINCVWNINKSFIISKTVISYRKKSFVFVYQFLFTNIDKRRRQKLETGAVKNSKADKFIFFKSTTRPLENKLLSIKFNFINKIPKISTSVRNNRRRYYYIIKIMTSFHQLEPAETLQFVLFLIKISKPSCVCQPGHLKWVRLMKWVSPAGYTQKSSHES